MLLSEEEVRKSFARVKEDILQVKRSLNKQVFSVEEINKAIGNALGKEEFYAFIKRLGSKIEELENSFPAKSDKEDVDELASGLRNEIAALRKLLQQRDDLADDVREVRSLKGKVLELEGSSVSKAEFSKEAAKLKAELSAVKASAKTGAATASDGLSSLASSLSKLTSSLADLGAKLNSLAAKAVAKEDIAAFTDRIESSHQEALRGFSALKRDVDKKTAFASTVEEKLLAFSEKLAESERMIGSMGDVISKKLVDKSAFEKSISELRSKINDAQKLLESSVSEVNLDDYVTKRSLKQQISSLSESVSAVPSRVNSVEEQLQSLKSQLDSAQKSVQKQLGRETQKFAAAKDIEKVREELERLSSGFIPSGDFYSKLDKLEGSSEKASGDFKKEIRRQRELFEERLKSLESYYRSSNDTLKAEVEQLRSSIKALSKAGEHARVEMAKISTSAAKVAAKTAADLIEDADEETREAASGRRGKGLPPLAVSVIIVALLLIGSVSYVLLKGGEAPVQPQDNVTQPIIPPITVEPVSQPEQTVEPAEPVAQQPEQPSGQPEEQQPPAPETSNATANATIPSNVSSNLSAAEEPSANVSAVVNVTAAPDSDSECIELLECQQRADGQFGFDCYFDNISSQCRCFVGGIEKCPQLLVENETARVNESAMEGREEAKGKAPGARYYGIVAFIVLVVAFFAYRTLFVKEESEEGKSEKADKAQKAEKSREKPKAKEEKEPEKPAAGEDDDVIDLEEFFEKKETKKK